MEKKTIVLALGGNAIVNEGDSGEIEQQIKNVNNSLDGVVELVREGHRIVLTHGNGPQAGVHLIRNEQASHQVPPSPLNVIVADTQGSIGYIIQQQLVNKLRAAGIKKNVVTVVTQVVVDPEDPSMKNPSKYVGPFFKAEDVEALKKRGWIMKEDPGRGFRRVVPSPLPLDVVEKETVHTLLDAGCVVISVGGGGVPVYQDAKGDYIGVDAVIDKDRASALLANLIKADDLIIITGVEKVAVNYKKPDQKYFDVMTVAECERYQAEGQFPKGSMGPKIEAACDFIKGGGKNVIITDIDHSCDAATLKVGTVIVK